MRNRVGICWRIWPLLVCGLFIGCDGGEEANPIGQAPPAPPPASAPSRPAVPVATPTHPSPTSRAQNSNTETPAPPPPNTFTILPDNLPGRDYVILPKTQNANIFAVEKPAPGFDSRSFHIVETPTAAELTEKFNPDPNLKILPGMEIDEPAGYSKHGLPWRIINKTDGSVMALVPAGPSLLGTNFGDNVAGPQVAVELGDFYMDITEVTVGQYEKFYDEAARVSKGRKPSKPLNADAPDDHPALGVSWRDAKLYAEWAGKNFGGKTLPTEAQWEKAARGNADIPYLWGTEKPFWSRQRQPGQIDPVRSFRNDVSRYGIFDLAGNAREWCDDWYRADAHQLASQAAEKPLKDWTGPTSAEPAYQHVIKGSPTDWFVWSRSHARATDQLPWVGFRCVLRVPPSGSTPQAADASPKATRN